MREAEDETIAYNLYLKEKEEKEKQEADELRKQEEEKQKKAEEDKKGASKRKQSANVLRSGASLGMRKHQRSNVQRIARPMLKPQSKKPGRSRQSSAAKVLTVNSNSAKKQKADIEESKTADEEMDKVLDELMSTDPEKTEEVELLDLTDSELATLKKNIYDEGFKKFEEEYGNNVS